MRAASAQQNIRRLSAVQQIINHLRASCRHQGFCTGAHHIDVEDGVKHVAQRPRVVDILLPLAKAQRKAQRLVAG